jgi:DNA-binding GntR family transcriptional regulator
MRHAASAGFPRDGAVHERPARADRGADRDRDALAGLAIEHGRTTYDIAPDGTPSAEWFRAHEEFHRTLLDGCGNSWLIDTATTLRAAAGLHRRWSGSIGHDYDRDVAGEHREILNAALARDANVAVELLAQHIQRTTDALLAVVGETP